MSTKEAPVAGKVSKKQVRQTVYEKLALALSEYKSELKNKRFESNLKKASKLFAADIARAGKQNANKTKAKKKKPATESE